MVSCMTLARGSAFGNAGENSIKKKTMAAQKIDGYMLHRFKKMQPETLEAE